VDATEPTDDALLLGVPKMERERLLTRLVLRYGDELTAEGMTLCYGLDAHESPGQRPKVRASQLFADPGHHMASPGWPHVRRNVVDHEAWTLAEMVEEWDRRAVEMGHVGADIR